MTNRERELASLGFEYAAGIERASGPLVLPGSGREVRRTAHGWEVQPWDDNYWVEFADVLDAIRAGTRAEVGRQPTGREAAAMSDERNEKSRLESSRAMSNTGYHANGKPRWWARVGTGTSARFLEIPFCRGDRHLDCEVDVPPGTKVSIGAGKGSHKTIREEVVTEAIAVAG